MKMEQGSFLGKEAMKQLRDAQTRHTDALPLLTSRVPAAASCRFGLGSICLFVFLHGYAYFSP